MIWKPFPALPTYEVSDEGQVRLGPAGQPLHTEPDENGYWRIRLARPCGKRLWFRVHLLVLETFVGEAPTPRHRGRHLDEDRNNNRLENLSWVAPKKPEPKQRVKVELPHPICTSCGKLYNFEAIVQSSARLAKLSPKETEVLVMLFKGFEYQEIADALGNTHQSIKCIASTIMEKFDVGSRMELVNVIYPL